MDLVGLVAGVLQDERPKNVDASATIVTNEGPEVEIVIVAHRDLDGVSLVVITDKKGARVLWAHVKDLSYHDDLDLGVVTERISYEGDWRGRLREALIAELRRPIRLHRRPGFLGGAPRVECWIAVGDKDKRIATFSSSKGDVPGATRDVTSLAGGGGSAPGDRARSV
jgi:hypothetical protein